jgi:hypothetical protein
VLLSRSSAVTEFFTAATNVLQPTTGILFVYMSRVTNSDQSKGIEETAAKKTTGNGNRIARSEEFNWVEWRQLAFPRSSQMMAVPLRDVTPTRTAWEPGVQWTQNNCELH